MNKIIYLFLTAIIISSCTSVNNIGIDQIKKNQTIIDTDRIIGKLASDEFLGRKPGEKSFTKTITYVSDFFNSNRISPYFEDSYLDTCFVNGKESYNVVALIGERDPSKEHILIGAHLDHLGFTRDQPDSIYNGANDNASGVTAVLQIAKELNKYKFDKNIIIALFTGEESGLVGSTHLAQKMKEQHLNLSFMLNFEMIGKTLTTGENQVYLTGYHKSNCADEMNKIMDRNFATFLHAEITYNLFYRSDNLPFYNTFQVPCHSLSTFDFKNYDHYHKKTDDVSELDIKNMNEIINSSTLLISKLLLNDTKLELIKTEKK